MDKRKLSDNELNMVAGGERREGFGEGYFRPTPPNGEGMIPCETCGTMNYPDFIACTHCGAPIPMLPPSEE